MKMTGLTRVFSHEEIDPERPGHKEPCLNICRRELGGKGRRVVIPLQNLYQYWETDGLAAKAAEFTAVLYGGVFNKSDLLRVGNCIDAGLDELFKMMPARERTQSELEKEMEALGIKLSIDGKTIVDAT